MRRTAPVRAPSEGVEDPWRALLANIPDIIILLDREARIRYVNHTVPGLRQEDAVGASAYDFVPPEHRVKMRSALAQVFRTGRPVAYEIAGTGPHRTESWYSSRVGPVIRGGEVTGATIVTTDITERRRAEEQLRASVGQTRRALEDLRRAQQDLIRAGKLASIGMLVSGIAHELNNPINVVYGNLKLLKQGCEMVSRHVRGGEMGRRVSSFKRMLRDAERAAGRARDIIEGFGDFARDTRSAEAADLNERLEETLKLLAKTMGSRVRVVRRYGRLPPVRCLKGQINQVFFNLIRNAVEAIPGRGTVTVRTRLADGEVRVEVRDTGRGMSDEVQQKLFEPFFTTKEVGQGLGIGLAISAMIVQNHGGKITCRSRPGRGTTFTVHLPVQTAGP